MLRAGMYPNTTRNYPHLDDSARTYSVGFPLSLPLEDQEYTLMIGLVACAEIPPEIVGLGRFRACVPIVSWSCTGGAKLRPVQS